MTGDIAQTFTHLAGQAASIALIAGAAGAGVVLLVLFGAEMARRRRP